MKSGDPVVLYAARFARKCLLEHLCPTGHPVLDMEIQLISEAKNGLQNHLLQNGEWCELFIKDKIKQHAIKKVCMLAEDDDVCKKVALKIQNNSLEDIFPSIN
jgi:hypothetical protein